MDSFNAVVIFLIGGALGAVSLQIPLMRKVYFGLIDWVFRTSNTERWKILRSDFLVEHSRLLIFLYSVVCAIYLIFLSIDGGFGLLPNIFISIIAPILHLIIALGAYLVIILIGYSVIIASLSACDKERRIEEGDKYKDMPNDVLEDSRRYIVYSFAWIVVFGIAVKIIYSWTGLPPIY